ncbi:hypothetical protein CMEL01_07541 [Colletotrichum melonis]|uniref:Uncharacterized protein n=2 Tax=Colletotrichum acutatum species complex TaxID=2707335 RepID=A0AAI9U4M0_9PEZI|nr:hypothetical protein CLIM01_02892 [Colletotrichum limetticola]KAK1450205.1 hypothetical protein CMEL01_07541 [Colletotrichum melonis]
MATTPPIDDQSERYLVAISRIVPARPMMDCNPRHPTSPRESRKIGSDLVNV